MAEWKTYRLGELVRVKGGKRLPKGISLQTTPNTHPYIRIRDMGKSRVLELDATYEYVDDVTQKSIARYVVDEGDILLSIVGTIGLVGIVGKSLHQANQTENCVKLVNLNGIDPLFLYYYLLSPNGQDEIKRGTVGAVQAKLPIKNIENINISLPGLEEQRRIAGILSAIDDKIEINRRINDNLEQQAQALYKQWFVDNRNDDWEERPLSEIIFFQEGPGIRNWQYVEKKGVRFINIRCINDGDVNVQNANMISEDEACGKYAHFLLEPLDIVMSCSGTLGRYAIIRQEHLPLCLNTSVIRFRPAQCIEDYPFVYGYLSSAEFLNKQEEMACGSVQANFGPTHLKQIKIKVPPKDYRMKYNNVVMPIINTMLKNRSEINMLSSLRDTLLPKLMNGEIKL